MTIIDLADWAMYLGFAAGGVLVVAVVVTLWPRQAEAEERTIVDDLNAEDRVQINLQDLPLPRRGEKYPRKPRHLRPQPPRLPRTTTYKTPDNQNYSVGAIRRRLASLDFRAVA